MTEPKVFIYEVGRCNLDNGQEILVQIFRHEDTHLPSPIKSSHRARQTLILYYY